MKKLPWKFSYRLEDTLGRESTMMIEDWEIGALHWNCIKAASALHPGDVLEIPFPAGPGTRTITIVALADKRVGAAEARAYYEESTAPEVFEAQKNWHLARAEGQRGRPSKKDRREIDRIRGFFA